MILSQRPIQRLLLVGLLVLAGCGANNEVASGPTPTPPATRTPAPIPTRVETAGSGLENVLIIPDEDLSQAHVDETETVDYVTNPPLGGEHWGRTAEWGAYPDEPPADEQLVHNLEHGGVIIWFDPDVIQGEDYDELFGIYQTLTDIDFHTALVARSGMETPLAMTAWGALLRLDSIDATAMTDFYSTYILQGPECIERRCPR